MTAMRAGIAVAAIGLAFGLTAAGCSTLPERAWCSNTGELTGRDCGFDTYRQCMASLSGLSGGNCTENPRYRGERRMPRQTRTR